MHAREALEIVSDLATQQWGLLTTAQAKLLGVDSKTLHQLSKRGFVVQMRHGVYATASTALTEELEVKAQWLALKPDLMAHDRLSGDGDDVVGVVSHTTAASLWGIGDLWPDGSHFTTRTRRRSRQSDVTFHMAELSAAEWDIHPGSGLPVTTVARTIADLAKAGHEPDHLRDVLSDAASGGCVDLPELVDALEGCEEAFGLAANDHLGLAALVENYLPSKSVPSEISQNIDDVLRPVAIQLQRLADALEPLSAKVKELGIDPEEIVSIPRGQIEDMRRSLSEVYQSHSGENGK